METANWFIKILCCFHVSTLHTLHKGQYCMECTLSNESWGS
jgi:hypothetical protein